MIIRKISVGLLLLALTTSCVSKKLYNDLENKYADLKKESREMSDSNEDLAKAKNNLELEQTALQDELNRTKAQRDKYLADLTAGQNNMKNLQSSYSALEKNSDDALKTNMDKNRELLAKLEAKEKALAVEQERLNKLMADFQERSNRVAELEGVISAQGESLKKLKATLSKALNAFEGKGLTVEQKNGKVYVSMENKLLFQTGSWTVGSEGRKAVVEVGKVLGQNPEITVLIEGHTDNDKFAGAMGQIENNWDLSTKRATAIVNILSENKAINKQSLTAAGRGEYAPLASNETAEGKAKNRRIEIILTPKLDEISKMLNDL
ncbi:OmpA family protein [Flavobacterium antarcticum]